MDEASWKSADDELGSKLAKKIESEPGKEQANEQQSWDWST